MPPAHKGTVYLLWETHTEIAEGEGTGLPTQMESTFSISTRCLLLPWFSCSLRNRILVSWPSCPSLQGTKYVSFPRIL